LEAHLLHPIVSIFVVITDCAIVVMDADGHVVAAVDCGKEFQAEFDPITIFGLVPDYVS